MKAVCKTQMIKHASDTHHIALFRDQARMEFLFPLLKLTLYPFEVFSLNPYHIGENSETQEGEAIEPGIEKGGSPV